MFKDRNFSLANTAITTVGFAITAMAFPLMLYAQSVRGLSPTRSALLLVPMAVISGALAPFVGRLTDRAASAVHRRIRAALLLGLDVLAQPGDRADRRRSGKLLLPIALLGVANGFMWAPLGSTATRNLPMHQAGAGAGVYNTTRQVGAVLGSAGIAVLMESRLATNLPADAGRRDGRGRYRQTAGGVAAGLQ